MSPCIVQSAGICIDLRGHYSLPFEPRRQSYYSVSLLLACRSCWCSDAVFVSALLDEVFINHVAQEKF